MYVKEHQLSSQKTRLRLRRYRINIPLVSLWLRLLFPLLATPIQYTLLFFDVLCSHSLAAAMLTTLVPTVVARAYSMAVTLHGFVKIGSAVLSCCFYLGASNRRIINRRLHVLIVAVTWL